MEGEGKGKNEIYLYSIMTVCRGVAARCRAWGDSQAKEHLVSGKSRGWGRVGTTVSTFI